METDEIEPEDYEQVKNQVLTKLGIKKPRAVKKDFPVFAKSSKSLQALKKEVKITSYYGKNTEDRPPSTGNRLNKWLHGKKHKKKLMEEQKKKQKEEGLL